MNLNPTIRTSRLWLVLTFLADVSFGYGYAMEQFVWVVVALPVLFFAFPLSALAALSELTSKSVRACDENLGGVPERND